MRDERRAKLSQAGNSHMPVMLILGGARSGKSRIAQEMAESGAGPLTFVATGEAFDDEMTMRIARHQADRGSRWSLIEAPLDLPQVLLTNAATTSPTLVDCLTVWLGNLMHHDRNISSAMDDLIAALQQPRAHPLYLVSNEVGQGIVPDNALARAFRDHAGQLNQRVAGVADDVLFVVAGLTQVLKGGDGPPR
jgi:adenosylcobinamide kinase/adenosylcobinamide-phosphate guanylyltransferase